MSEIPLLDGSPNNEWIKALSQSLSEDEQTIRAIVSESCEDFQPSDSEKEAALKDIVTDIYFKTSETPYDNSPQGRIWVQFPYDGYLGAHYEYYCDNPPHPAPDQLNVTGGRNWTYVKHTVTKVDSQVREVMQDINYFQPGEDEAYLRSEFDDNQITLVRGVRHPDFSTLKRILTEGFNLDISDVCDAWGLFRSEWAESRVYWND